MASEINLTPTASYLTISPTSNGQGSQQLSASHVPARSWGTATDCVGGALLVHGLGAHSGWFEALGRRLKVRRIFSLAYDQVGFGRRRSEEFISQEQWYNDVATGFAHLKGMVGDKPIFIMGNSMGAAVALKVVADRSVTPDGLVLFSPGFDGHPDLFKWNYKVSALVSAFLHPEREVKLPYTVDMITRSESVRTWLSGDPDMRFSPTGRMLLEVLKMSFKLPKLRSLNCPLFMLRSGIETIVDGNVAQKIFDRISAPSKKQVIFDEAWHDLMFDPVIEDLTEQVVQWMGEVSTIRQRR